MTPTPAQPPLSDSHSADLFDDCLSAWLDSPELAFAIWVARRQLKDSTKTVYKAMWGSFIAWVRKENLTLRTVDGVHVTTFLDKAEHINLKGVGIKTLHRAHYIRLLERTFDHLGRIGLGNANPARLAVQDGAGLGENDDSRFLTEGERAAVFRRFSESIAKFRRGKIDKETWVEFRDYAMVGVMLGGGLKVGQVQGVTNNCMVGAEGGGILEIDLPPRRGVSVGHKAPVLPFAREMLRTWLAMGQDGTPWVASGTGLLFPADRNRGVRPQTPNERLHAASIFRRVQSFLAASGIKGERACPQTLRNTYAAILIEEGAGDTELMSALGIIKGRTCDRMRKSHTLWQERQLAAPATKVAAVQDEQREAA